ncbi:hypothetical protein [Nostoc sp. WHI]|uniref:hypothetical protein n=1 Tax=Nostoc sp. WHI TaxID=2650611 RepID=UPI001E3D9EB8|nr:hypothetical protein [Nostoc sp. WHI]
MSALSQNPNLNIISVDTYSLSDFAENPIRLNGGDGLANAERSGVDDSLNVKIEK